MNTFRQQVLRPGFKALALSLLAICISSDVEAARLNVQVINATGQPVANAQICFVATIDDRVRRDGKTTGNDGRGFFEISPASGNDQLSLKLTTSRSGFTGKETIVSWRGAVKDVVVTLSSGSGGPACPVLFTLAISIPMIDPQLRLVDFKVCNPSAGCSTSIAVRDGVAPAKLTYQVEAPAGRTVTHYRVAATESALANADFLPIPKASAGEQPIAFSFNVGNITSDVEKQLFFQVRAGQSLSNVRSDSTFLRNDPDLRIDHVIRGDELKEMLRFAQDQGFTVMRVVQNELGGPASPGVAALMNRLVLSTSCASASHMRLSFLTGPALNPPWKIKTILIDPTNDCASTVPSAVPVFGFFQGTPMVTLRHGQISAEDRANATRSNRPPAIGCEYPLRKIVLEGPASGFRDARKPWKDAFRH